MSWGLNSSKSERIMNVLARLRDDASDLPRTREALSDALITVYNALGDDLRVRERCREEQHPAEDG